MCKVRGGGDKRHSHKKLMFLKPLGVLLRGGGVAGHTPPPQLLPEPATESLLRVRQVPSRIEDKVTTGVVHHAGEVMVV